MDALKEAILKPFFEVVSAKSKEDIRALHIKAASTYLKNNYKNVAWLWGKYGHWFADGSDLRSDKISPRIIEVKTKEHADIFRLARLTWSMPYSSGYGRRIRFLVIDDNNGKLIGVIGLSSPPMNLMPRDEYMKVAHRDDKPYWVNRTADIFTLGALPPYSFLLGGKLVAMLATSDTVQRAYHQKYNTRLLALTTTSAFGRSSIYNRLKMHGKYIAMPIGYTKGYGTWHLNDIYEEIKEALKERGEFVSGWANGRMNVWRNIKKLAKSVGVDEDVLHHGVRRQIFIFPLADNIGDVVLNNAAPQWHNRHDDVLIDFWRNRWLKRRAQTNGEWRVWRKRSVWRRLGVGDNFATQKRLL